VKVHGSSSKGCPHGLTRMAKTSLVSAAALVGSAMALSRVLGFFRNSVIAALFGQNNVTDAYNTAFLIPDTLYLILIGGGISSAFIPVLARYISEKREDEGWRVISIAFSVTLVGMSAILAVGIAAAPDLVHIIAPWFSPAKAALTVALTRITLITILFHSLNGVLIGTEYAYNTFLATSIGPLVYNGSIIVFGALLAPRVGIFAFAYSTLIGSVLNFGIQLWGTWRLKPSFTFSLDIHHPGLVRVARLMVPVMVGLSIAQLNLLFNQAFLASQLAGGTINALVISSRVMLVPVLVATSIGIAMLPSLTAKAVEADMNAFRSYFSRALRAVVFVSLPSAVGLMILARPIVRILFQHGHFSAAATSVTSATLFFYSIGIIAYGSYEIISRAFYALEDTKTPLYSGLVAVAIGIVLNIVLIRFFTYRGLAFAYSLTGFINAGVLLVLLRRKVGRVGGTQIGDALWRTAGATAAMAVALVLFGPYLSTVLLRGQGIPGELVQLLSPILMGLLVFLGVAQLLRMPEVGLILGILRRRRGSGSKAQDVA